MSAAFVSLVTGLVVVSAGSTWAFLRHAVRIGRFDVPNARSSHTVPVPRGGGLVFAALTLAGLLVWSKLAPGAQSFPAPALLVLGLVSLLGVLDDHVYLSAVFRLVCQFVLATATVLSLDAIVGLPLPGGYRLEHETVLAALFVTGLVWLVNLYNFMDGIDALAASEAVFVALCGAALCWLRADTASAAWLLILGGCVTGFLVWNLPPARVFMGDAGSVFLGFFFGVVALLSHGRGGPEIWVWLILLGTFCVDATVTLAQRLRFGQRALDAHRTHAFQYLARRHGGHGPVALGVAIVNLGWLAPWALAATLLPEWGGPFLLVAYAPLAVLAVRVGAGVPESGPGSSEQRVPVEPDPPDVGRLESRDERRDAAERHENA